MEISITKIMDKDHKKIKELFEEFENEKDLEKSLYIFNKFKWNLQKHFFIEENLIFSSEVLEDSIEISQLLEEHSDITRLVDVLGGLIINKKPDSEELKKSLINHANFEDQIFYPKLDDFLNLEQKQEIINKSKEIII